MISSINSKLLKLLRLQEINILLHGTYLGISLILIELFVKLGSFTLELVALLFIFSIINVISSLLFQSKK